MVQKEIIGVFILTFKQPDEAEHIKAFLE